MEALPGVGIDFGRDCMVWPRVPNSYYAAVSPLTQQMALSCGQVSGEVFEYLEASVVREVMREDSSAFKQLPGSRSRDGWRLSSRSPRLARLLPRGISMSSMPRPLDAEVLG